MKLDSNILLTVLGKVGRKKIFKEIDPGEPFATFESLVSVVPFLSGQVWFIKRNIH